MTAATRRSRRSDALETTLAEKTQHYLDLCVYDNARFLAERLVAHRRSEENVYLLAKCLHASGHASQAIAVLEGATEPLNRYLLALCCFEQNKLVEAENALRGDNGDHYVIDDLAAARIPNGAAGLYLMGRICRRANRREQAIELFVKSLELDTTMWAAYEQLCELGADMDAAQFFGDATYLSSDRSDDSASESDETNDNGSDTDDYIASSNNTTSEAPFDDAFATPEPRPLPPQTGVFPTGTDVRIYTSAARPPSHSSSVLAASKTPSVSSASHVGDSGVKKLRVGSSASVATPNPRARKHYRRPLAANDDDTSRRNARLSCSSAVTDDATPVLGKPSASAPLATPLATRLFHDVDTPEPVPQPAAVATQRRKTRDRIDGKQHLLRLLSTFGAIYQKQCMYLSREALAMLEQLPATQLASGWVQQQIGRAHFEMAEYNLAHGVFEAMHRAEPHRMAGLDVYSTTLWHLKKEVELSYLAQQVTELDKRSSEAWCVAGNCFSLQKEHDTALAFFQRAIQLDPSFTYAYTLSGHEYVANEDFEKAISCYRHAIRTDPRHYNAWYGLGTLYFRQEKFAFAEYHFQRALAIHPRSSLLHCFLGMVYHATRQFDDALRVLAVAGELQPLNPQARFQRANVLITQHRYDEALAELKIVRNFAPRESSVHFMMGKVAKKLGRVDDAMRFFTTALYFHPKDNNVIKAAIDKIHEPDLDDDDRL